MSKYHITLGVVLECNGCSPADAEREAMDTLYSLSDDIHERSARLVDVEVADELTCAVKE
jgi:hypothetical protein